MRFAQRSLRAALGALAGALVVLACSSEDSEPSAAAACFEVGQRCTTDEGCCSGNCMWQGDGAYCQNRNVADPLCGRGADGCTQNRHCCSKTCNAGTCTRDPSEPTNPPGGCADDRAECTSGTDCCNGICTLDDASGKMLCGSS